MAEAGPCRGDAPPRFTKKLDVWRVTTSEAELFTILSEAPFGKWVHWFGRRSHECHRDTGQCKGCVESWPSKWKCYLHVAPGMGKVTGFLELTLTAFNMILEQLPKEQMWRGVRMKIRRTKGGAKGRYIVEVLESRQESTTLPPEIDPLETLRFLWNCKKGPGQIS